MRLANRALFASGLAIFAASTPLAQGGPPPVVVARVELRDVSPVVRFVGRVEAMQAVDIRARVDGYLEGVLFEEGRIVRAGDPLFRIEAAPYEAALAQAKASLARTEAVLRQAEQTYERQRELRNRNVVADARLDEAAAARDVAAAEVAAARAGIRSAELNLSFTLITAPITGRVGRAGQTRGNLVGPALGQLARVTQVDPIRVVFSINDRDLVAERRVAASTTQESLNRSFVPRLVLSDGRAFPREGEIDFIDNEVDRATGTIAVRALFSNPEGLLTPGQFVNVEIRRDREERRPVVSAAAVQRDREGPFVLVAAEDGTVALRRLTLGASIDQGFAVLDGLKEGETVVVEGIQRIRPGMAVRLVRQEARTQ